MTHVRVPKYAEDLRFGDLLDGCPDGCQCTRGGHVVQHLRIDAHPHPRPEPPPLVPRGTVVVESCTDFPARTYRLRDIVTVLVDVERISPMRSHAQRITASDLRARGRFRWYDKHHVACSCGWRLDEPVTGGAPGYARGLWMEHKAEAITALLAPRYTWLNSSAAVLRETDPEATWRYRVVLRNRGGAR